MSILSSDIKLAAEFLKKGELVAIPTETVYGLACNALDANAVQKIYSVKGRPSTNPLIIHVASVEELSKWVKDIPLTAINLARQCWPGPLTMVLPKKESIPDCITSNQDTVAIRIPDHPLTLSLLSILPFPLAAPSANLSGYISPTTAMHVEKQLGEMIPLILDGGQCKQGIESTIIGFEGDKIIVYRKGAYELKDLELMSKMCVKNNGSNEVMTPGMMKKHYSPRKPFYVTRDVERVVSNLGKHHVGILSFKQDYSELGKNWILSTSGSLGEAMHNLYAYMHEMDESEIECIVAEWMPNEGIGAAINDRLDRAGAGTEQFEEK